MNSVGTIFLQVFQVMHDRITHSFVLNPLHGYFQGIPSSHWLLVTSLLFMPLPAKALPLLDESSNQRLFFPDRPCTCILPSGGIPQGSFFIHLSERKHLLKIHQAQLTHHVFDSYVQGKCMFTWHTAPTLHVLQHTLHLLAMCAHD